MVMYGIRDCMNAQNRPSSVRSVSFRLPWLWRASNLRIRVVPEADILRGRGFLDAKNVRSADVQFGEGTAVHVAVFLGDTMLEMPETVRMKSGRIYLEDERLTPVIGRRVFGEKQVSIVPWFLRK